MITTLPLVISDIDYPDSDGLPMAESDFARNYLVYGVEALNFYFRDQPQVYVSGNLFIYYEKSNPKAVIAPDVFVIFAGRTHLKMVQSQERYRWMDKRK
jgi:hypothetical protein